MEATIIKTENGYALQISYPDLEDDVPRTYVFEEEQHDEYDNAEALLRAFRFLAGAEGFDIKPSKYAEHIALRIELERRNKE